MSRIERSVVGDWWWTIDRVLLATLASLMVSGLVFLMAGGPPVADRLGYSTFHFVNRQALFLLPAISLMLAISFLSPRHIRKMALVVYVGGIALIFLALKFGPEIKGAHRWINLGKLSVQPSEFVKPAFVVLAAWLFSEATKERGGPALLLAFLLLPATIVPLLLQPDFGQTVLVALVWGGLLVVAGLHVLWIAGLMGAGCAGAAGAYLFFPHVRGRIERFLDKAGGDSINFARPQDNFQVDTALDSFVKGGWLGQGPGEGVVKRILPDAHTDFIFAVTGEEFGIIVCLAIVAAYGLIVLRGLVLARRDENMFARLAITGLVMLFGLQACINMAVNVHIMPAKGMTLPFISYGGSSLISLAIGMGFLMALTRRRPRSQRLMS